MIVIPNFRPSRFNRGLIVDVDPGRLLCAPGVKDFTRPALFPWDRLILPTPAQRGDSCNGEGWLKGLAIAILQHDRKAIPRGYLFDPWRVYLHARKMFFPGQGDRGGLRSTHAHSALIDLGVVPPDASFSMPAETWDGLCTALEAGAVCFGGLVHAGYGRWDPRNGCIDHAPRPDAASGGHWMCIVGTLQQGDRRFVVIDQSWGRDKYWNGLMLMTWEELCEVRMARFMAWRFPTPIMSWDFTKHLVKRAA